MKKITLTDDSIKDLLEKLLQRSPVSYGEYEDKVLDIIYRVRKEGDAALFDYTKQFDHVDLDASNLIVTKEEIESL